MTNIFRNSAYGFAVSAAIILSGMSDSRADAPVGQYVISNNTVFDTKSQLLWEQNPVQSKFTWNEAKAYCQNLATMGMGWRLPSMKESQTIIDETRVDPSVDTLAFPNAAMDQYWTSTLRAANTTQAWTILFDYGATNVDDLGATHYVRCVR